MSPDEALLHLQQWGHTTTMMLLRIMDPGTGPVTRQGDMYLFAMAARQALRFAELIETLCPADVRSEIAEALDAFRKTSPQIKDIRDVLDHMDEYLTGKGSSMKRADLRAGKPSDHSNEWLQVWKPSMIWVEPGDGTQLLRISPRPGKILTLDVGRDEAAVRNLVDAISQALSPGRRRR